MTTFVRHTLNLKHYVATLLLVSCCTMATASPIFGHWALDPQYSDKDESNETSAKLSRKEKKLAKKRAKARQTFIPDVLKSKALQIKQQGEQSIALIPERGTNIVVQANGQAASASLSQWGATSTKNAGFSLWEGDTLVIETTPRPGLHITHSYRVNGAGRLVQSIELYDGLDAYTQLRVFTRQPPTGD